MLAKHNARYTQFFPAVKKSKDCLLGSELEFEINTYCRFSHKIAEKENKSVSNLYNCLDKNDNSHLANAYANNINKPISKFCFVKRDGSLNNGLEIVSKPMNLVQHQNIAKDLILTVRKAQLQVKPTCGMHVHVSRNCLSELQLAKILQFMNDKQNYKFICKIAGRTANDYAKVQRNFSIANYLKNPLNTQNKYYNLNTKGKETIEFRIFKSVRTVEAYLKNLEFCKSLVDFCQNYETAALYTNPFVRFVEQNYAKNGYPNLYNFFVKQKFIAALNKTLDKSAE